MEGFGLFFVAAAVVAFFVGKKKLTAGDLAAAGREIGLRASQPGMFARTELNGRKGGFDVHVSTRWRRAGNRKQQVTYVEVRYPSLNLGLDLHRQIFGISHLATAAGRADHKTGDAAFDKTVVVEATSGDDVREFLTASRRARILRNMKSLDRFRVEDTRVSCEEDGITTNAGLLESRIRRLVGVAQELVSEEKADAPPVARKLVPPDPIAVVEAPEPPSLPPPAPLASERETVVAPAPLRPPPLPKTPPPLPEPPPVPKRRPAGIADLARVRRELFEEARGLSDADRRFTDHFEGRRVAWSGQLVRVESYQVDLVFVGAPGVRATVQIDPVDADDRRPLTVVAALPAEQLEAASELVPGRVTVHGTLLRCDVLTRRFHVSDARLERTGLSARG